MIFSKFSESRGRLFRGRIAQVLYSNPNYISMNLLKENGAIRRYRNGVSYSFLSLLIAEDYWLSI